MSWKNRMVERRDTPPADLMAHPDNARHHTAAQAAVVEGLLDSIGWVQDVIVSKKTNRILDGHLRVALAIQHNEPTVPVKYVEVTSNEERAVLATFDAIGILAQVQRDYYAKAARGARQTENPALEAFLEEQLERYAPKGQPPAALAYDEDAIRQAPRSVEDGITASTDASTPIPTTPAPESYARMLHLYLTQAMYSYMLNQVSELQETFGTDNMSDTIKQAVDYAYHHADGR